MLASTGLCNDFLLSQPLCYKSLRYYVVNLVRSCMVQVFTLQVDLCTKFFREVCSIVERRGPAYIVFKIVVYTFPEIFVKTDFFIIIFKFEKYRHQCLGDITSTENTEMAVLVRIVS